MARGWPTRSGRRAIASRWRSEEAAEPKPARGREFSHTASLAGSLKIFDALCKQAGALPRGNWKPVDMAVTFRFVKRTSGPNVVVVVGGGGGRENVLAADNWPPPGSTFRRSCRNPRPNWPRSRTRPGPASRNPIDTTSLGDGVQATLRPCARAPQHQMSCSITHELWLGPGALPRSASATTCGAGAASRPHRGAVRQASRRVCIRPSVSPCADRRPTFRGTLLARRAATLPEHAPAPASPSRKPPRVATVAELIFPFLVKVDMGCSQLYQSHPFLHWPTSRCCARRTVSFRAAGNGCGPAPRSKGTPARYDRDELPAHGGLRGSAIAPATGPARGWALHRVTAAVAAGLGFIWANQITGGALPRFVAASGARGRPEPHGGAARTLRAETSFGSHAGHLLDRALSLSAGRHAAGARCREPMGRSLRGTRPRAPAR